jgi:hypothetical protein
MSIFKELNEISSSLEELCGPISNKTYILACKLVLTCGACPEQYDVFYEEKQIGYLRLRHGRFYAEYVYLGASEIVYVAHPKGDGIFDDSERQEQLTKAIKALLARHKGALEQMMVYILNIETNDVYKRSKIIGVYSTQLLAETAATTITNHCTSIIEMILDANPKE